MAAEKVPHIFIIEDDQKISRMLEILLTDDGFYVELSNKGSDGLERMKVEKPDLLILDILMPGQTGLEVMEEMHSDFRTKDIPILFLSAIKEEETIVTALKGADDYIVKPFKPLELKERIRKILERKAAGATGIGAERLPYDRVPVQIGKEIYLVPFEEIYFVKASGNYSYIHTRGRRFLTGFSIGKLEEKLSGSRHFLRVHRSYIVNFDHIHMIRKDSPQKEVIVLGDEDNSEIPVGNSYYPNVKGLLDI